MCTCPFDESARANRSNPRIAIESSNAEAAVTCFRASNRSATSEHGYRRNASRKYGTQRFVHMALTIFPFQEKKSDEPISLFSLFVSNSWISVYFLLFDKYTTYRSCKLLFGCSRIIALEIRTKKVTVTFYLCTRISWLAHLVAVDVIY